MKDSYFNLSDEKQMNLFHSGCKVFAHNPYIKASMSKVASEAGISKSLLFYYFDNKKEYYFFIVNQVMDEIKALILGSFDREEKFDLFDKLIEIIDLKEAFFKKTYLYYELIKRVYYEQDESLQMELYEMKKNKMTLPYESYIKSISTERFKNEQDLATVLKIIVYCAEGLVINSEKKITKALINDYKDILISLKNNYYRREA